MRTDVCRYFAGLGAGDTCLIGVAYDSVAEFIGRPSRTLPCFAASGLKCSRQAFPTQEEVDAEEREMAQSEEHFRTAKKAILGDARNKKGVSGKLDCPICRRGTLRYTIATNGHVQASCTTENCVAWME
jgi:hypothetical protein